MNNRIFSDKTSNLILKKEINPIKTVDNYTINATRRNNNCLSVNPVIISKNNTIKIRNSLRHYRNDLKLLDKDSNSQIIKKLKNFKPKNSNIKELDNKSENKNLIMINTGKKNDVKNREKIIKNIMNYFGFCGEDVPIIRKKRNSFSSLEFNFNNNKERNK